MRGVSEPEPGYFCHRMRVFIKIGVILMTLLCVFSCDKDEAQLQINTFIVSGTVVDYETGEGLTNITVSLMGYSPDDSRMVLSPISNNTAYTDLDGNYKFTIIKPKSTNYYKIVAWDTASNREGGKYQSSLKMLYLSDGTAYHERSKTYELNNIDFYLTK